MGQQVLSGSCMGRRGFIGFACIATLSCMFPLAGCTVSEAKESVGVDAPFAVAAAFGDEFKVVQAAMHEEADDAVLLAVRSSSLVSTEAACSWSYLFGSAREGCAYTAFTSDEKAFPAYYGTYTLSEEAWSSIPDVSEVKVDADEAFSLAVQELGESVSVENCYLYLLTYVAESEDPSAGTMRWYVECNAPATTEAQAALEASGSSSVAEEDKEPQAVVAVDARTGRVERLK